jgi:hypothetical protein
VKTTVAGISIGSLAVPFFLRRAGQLLLRTGRADATIPQSPANGQGLACLRQPSLQMAKGVDLGNGEWRLDEQMFRGCGGLAGHVADAVGGRPFPQHVVGDG